jgi:hypothetical protein
MTQKFFIFCGVTSGDTDVLSRLCHPGIKSVVFMATGTSQKSLPSNSDIHALQKACSCLVFPGGINLGLAGPQSSVDLKSFLEGKKASVVYVDQGTELYWAGNKIDMKGEKAVYIEVQGTTLVKVGYFLPEAVPEVI